MAKILKDSSRKHESEKTRNIIHELKAVKELADIHFAQLRSSLRASGLRVGLLLNFAKPTLEIKRVVNSFRAFALSRFRDTFS
ncbi:MAG: GxxExxY protein [Pseudomonadota bacterium]